MRATLESKEEAVAVKDVTKVVGALVPLGKASLHLANILLHNIHHNIIGQKKKGGCYICWLAKILMAAVKENQHVERGRHD
jgi:hypothetical protein